MSRTEMIVGMISIILVSWIVWTVAPSEKTVYKTPAKPEVSDCQKRMPIKVGDSGFIKAGYWSEHKAKVVGKIDNGIDCAYSVVLRSNAGNREVYITVNASNFYPINGETVR